MGVHFEHSWLHLQKVNITVRLDYHCSGSKPALFPPKKRPSVLLEDRESGKNQAYITVGHVRENKKIIHFLFKGLLGRWIGPYKLNQILLCPISFRILFFSSWLLRQLAVRPPISIGMVRHVPLAPSVGQGTEWKPNVAKRKTQSVKNVGLVTIGRITRAWNRVFSKLSCTQYLRFWFIFEK